MVMVMVMVMVLVMVELAHDICFVELPGNKSVVTIMVTMTMKQIHHDLKIEFCTNFNDFRSKGQTRL